MLTWSRPSPSPYQPFPESRQSFSLCRRDAGGKGHGADKGGDYNYMSLTVSVTDDQCHAETNPAVMLGVWRFLEGGGGGGGGCSDAETQLAG